MNSPKLTEARMSGLTVTGPADRERTAITPTPMLRRARDGMRESQRDLLSVTSGSTTTNTYTYTNTYTNTYTMGGLSTRDRDAGARVAGALSGVELGASHPTVLRRLDSYVPYHRLLEGFLVRPDPPASVPRQEQPAQPAAGSLAVPADPEAKGPKTPSPSGSRPYWKNPQDVHPDVERLHNTHDRPASSSDVSRSSDKDTERTHKDSERTQKPANEKNARGRERILIIGHDVFAGGVVSAVLTRAGYHVIMTATAREAQTLIQEQNPTFSTVLIQATLPDMKGQDFIPFIRTTYGRDMPLGIIAPNSNQPGLESCFDLGADDIIYPPFHQVSTKQRVDTLIAFFWLRKRVDILSQDCRILCSENEALYKANVIMQQRIASYESYVTEQRHYLYENALIRAQQEEVIAERENAKMIAFALLDKTQEFISCRRKLMVYQDRAEYLEKKLFEVAKASQEAGNGHSPREFESFLMNGYLDDDSEPVKLPILRFPSSAPDWIHLFYQIPHFQMISWSKYLTQQMQLKESGSEKRLVSATTISTKSIFTSMLVILQNRIADWESNRIAKVYTPRAQKENLLREWLEFTFGKMEIKNENESKKEQQTTQKDGANVESSPTKNDRKKDNTTESAKDDHPQNKKLSEITQLRREPSGSGHTVDPHRVAKLKPLPNSPILNGRQAVPSFLFTYTTRRDWIVESKFLFDHNLAPDIRAMIDSLRFDSWRLSDRLYFPVAKHFFVHFNLIEHFSIPPEALHGFILALRDTSGTGPYHNFTRSVDIAQAVFFILLSSSVIDYISELDILCILIVALGSSLEHPGFTNQYLQRSNHNIFVLHGRQDTIEKHMHRVLCTILGCPELNIFTNMNETQLAEAHETIGILFQSLNVASSYGAVISKLASQVSDFQHLTAPLSEREKPTGLKKPIQYSNRIVILTSVLALASHIFLCRPSYIMSKWKDLFVEELTTQGNLETTHNMPPTPFATTRTEDENSTVLCTYMCDYIASPLLHFMRHIFSGLEAISTGLTRNRNNWAHDLTRKVVPQEQPRARSTSPVKSSTPTPGHLNTTSSSARESTGSASTKRKKGDSITSRTRVSFSEGVKYEEDVYSYIPECIRDVVRLRASKDFEPDNGPTSFAGPAQQKTGPGTSPSDYPPIMPALPAHPIGSLATPKRHTLSRSHPPSLVVQPSQASLTNVLDVPTTKPRSLSRTLMGNSTNSLGKQPLATGGKKGEQKSSQSPEPSKKSENAT